MYSSYGFKWPPNLFQCFLLWWRRNTGWLWKMEQCRLSTWSEIHLNVLRKYAVLEAWWCSYYLLSRLLTWYIFVPFTPIWWLIADHDAVFSSAEQGYIKLDDVTADMIASSILDSLALHSLNTGMMVCYCAKLHIRVHKIWTVCESAAEIISALVSKSTDYNNYIRRTDLSPKFLLYV